MVPYILFLLLQVYRVNDFVSGLRNTAVDSDRRKYIKFIHCPIHGYHCVCADSINRVMLTPMSDDLQKIKNMPRPQKTANTVPNIFLAPVYLPLKPLCSKSENSVLDSQIRKYVEVYPLPYPRIRFQA